MVRDTAIGLIDDLGAGRLERVEPPASCRSPLVRALRAFLERIARWDAAAWFAHREAYLATYGPLPFLPPDCQNAVILQATLGHADGLTFGGAPAAEHYVRSAPEFQEHVRAVSRLLGRRILQCRGVFLGGSDVLRRPEDEVVGYLEAIRGTFAGDPDASTREEVHAFLDDLSPPRPDARAFRRFKELACIASAWGSSRATPRSGGCTASRGPMRTWPTSWRTSKAAGLALSLVVLVGAGGEEHAEAHVEATANLITSLALGRGDIVALLDAEEVRDPERGGSSAAPGFTPLTGPRLVRTARGDQGSPPAAPDREGVKVVSYSLEKQMI